MTKHGSSDGAHVHICGVCGRGESVCVRLYIYILELRMRTQAQVLIRVLIIQNTAASSCHEVSHDREMRTLCNVAAFTVSDVAVMMT